MRRYSHTEAVARAAGYYRANPHRFVADFLHINLKWFQKVIIFAMNLNPNFCMIASRGIGKTFIIAIYCVVRCVLYPGTMVCVASGTRGQAIVVLEKIKTQLLPRSPELKRELKGGDIQISSQQAVAYFNNGSYIKVVTSSDSARSNRANLLVLDEFRMIDKTTIDTVLTKFLTTSRQPPYLSKPEYAYLKSEERNRQVYLSSAYFQEHWSYTKVKSFVKNMVSPDLGWFICSFPYQLAISEGLFSVEDIRDQMLDDDFNEIKWEMEMEAVFWGDSDGTFFSYETVARNRKIVYAMLPDELSAKVGGNPKVKIPQKQPGEKRSLSIDLALMASKRHKNDASALFINQMLPTKAGRFINNIVYAESSEGEHTEDQAVRVRKLFDQYMCDYIIIDARGVGFGVLDALLRDLTDPETGEIYPALSCCNNDDIAARCSNKNAEKAIWAILGSPKFNSECAVKLREGFRQGRIRLLENEYDADTALSEIKGYDSLPIYEKQKIRLAYINTTLLINELVNLQHEEKSGDVKIKEKANMRKDRYSSLSYNYWVSTQIESTLKRKSQYTSDAIESFLFRAPKVM